MPKILFVFTGTKQFKINEKQLEEIKKQLGDNQDNPELIDLKEKHKTDILPKEIRDRHGLMPGIVVEIEDAGETIMLRRSDDLPGLVEKDGILVFRARATGDLDGAIRAHREERFRTMRGPAR